MSSSDSGTAQKVDDMLRIRWTICSGLCTKRALWELDNIFRSLYLLNYIDSLTLRQNVQQAMNRGENYHQLRRVVSYANFGTLRFKTESEQLIWSECSRLITNCIIYCNATLLSRLLEIKEAAGETEQAVP